VVEDVVSLVLVLVLVLVEVQVGDPVMRGFVLPVIDCLVQHHQLGAVYVFCVDESYIIN
jgi:hypothetical protein